MSIFLLLFIHINIFFFINFRRNKSSTFILSCKRDEIKKKVSKKFKKGKIKHKKYANSIKKNTFLFIFFAVLVGLMLIFNISDIFSSLITQKRGFFYKDKIDVPSNTYYLVSAGQYFSESEAEEQVSLVKKNGGMGQIYHTGEYYVLASIYPTLSQAKEVQENLNSLNNISKVLKLSTVAISKDYFGEDKQTIESCFAIFKTIFLQLYNLNIDFDLNEISKTTFIGKVAVLSSGVLNLISSFKNVQSLNEKQKDVVLNALNNLNSILANIILSNEQNSLFSSQVKNAMFLLAEQNVLLCSEFS